MPASAATEQRRIEGTIAWRGRDSYRVRVHNGFDPSTGRRRYLYATGRGNAKAAERALRKLLSERDAGVDVQPRRVSVGDWLTKWLDGRIADGAVGPRAAENYRVILKARLTPAVGHIRLQELRADHVLALKTSLLEAKLAPATVRKQLGLLRQGLEAAVVAGLLARNPAAAVPSPSIVGSSKERRALSEDEIARLLEAAAETPYDVPIRLALATGLRQAEALGLTWSSVDLGRRTLVVEQTLAYVGGELRVLPPKTRNARRTIELSEVTVALLRAHRAAQNAERLQLGPGWRDGDLVFTRSDGSPQYRQAFLRGFHRLVGSSGIEEPATVNWHGLRHTAASLWIRTGVDIFTVSRRLGHASASFTMDTYGHLLSGQQRSAAEALDHLLAR